ncbi:uncharacterized protein LOC142318459 isoform X2 [Lycorma delicatula]|uniref:uncharacterized protein LOC142318459 isoform X2 n=1 Tax=Lycorma delicatula TaxID=130591 RepID=UPI003F513C52
MSIYYIIKKDDVLSKLTEASLCSFIVYLIYIFDVCGETVITEWENVRRALYGCNWINKPSWFKKIFLIIMIRNSKPIQISPFRIMVLNLRNFSAF